MQRNFKLFFLFVLFISFLLSFPSLSAEKHEHEHEENTVHLNAESQRMAGIVVTKLEPRELVKYVFAPGEVIPNADSTSKITSRVSAKVMHRKVQEGQHVKTGETLVVLSSVDISKIQGDLILAAQEWERVQSLGKDAISAKRYSEAQIAYQGANQTALASGMTEAEIKELLRIQKISTRKGEFELAAPRDGTVFNVNLTEGELVEPGRILLQIVDENKVWVDAKLAPDLTSKLNIGDKARIEAQGHSLDGRVIQVHHQLDETTRTRSIRIEAANLGDLLHPGQFVDCRIEAGRTAPLLAVPIDAIISAADGESAIYVEQKPGEFHLVEVKVRETIDTQAVIEGVSPGIRVVVKGAFFIHAELNKKGFETHQH